MRHLLRYSWSVLLLLASLLAPDVTTATILFIAGASTVVLAVLREKQLQRIMAELSDTLPISRLFGGAPKTVTSTALERSLTDVRRRMLVLAVAAELVVFAWMLIGNLDITVARNYALLILVALAPLGLEAELAVLMRTKHTRSSETVRTAVGYATEDAFALLAVIGLSFLGTVLFDIAPALSAIQILIITCIARPLLSGRGLQVMPHKTDRAWRVLFTSLLVYGSFVFFFIRNYIDPQFTDSTNPITWQGATVAMLTFIACQAALLLLNPAAPRSIALRGLSLAIILLTLLYIPALQDLVMTAGPSPADWVWVIISSLVFAALILLHQRFGKYGKAWSVTVR